MNYKEAMEYMEEAEKCGSMAGPAGMKGLCEALGNPEKQLNFIHIAGSSGKGSVLAFISTVLKGAGCKVGRYISPAVFEYRERIQVNGRSITKQGLCDCLEQVREAVRHMEEEGCPHPAPFEIETAAAFLYFKRCKCDLVVWEISSECSRYEAYAVSRPVAVVFTPISMEDFRLWGGTKEEAEERRADIIKNGCHVISTEQEPEVAAALQKRAEESGCPFHSADSAQIKKIKYGLQQQKFSYKNHKELVLSLAGQYQIRNCALAVEAIDVLGQCGFHVTESILRKGLLQTAWAGRFSVVAKKPLFIADGAHNAAAARKLAESLQFYFTNKRIIYIMGLLRDTEYDKIIAETYELADHIITVTVPDNKKAMNAYELAKEAEAVHPCVTAADSLQEAVELSCLLADRDSVIVAFGSLSYLGSIIRIVENKDKIRSDLHGQGINSYE